MDKYWEEDTKSYSNCSNAEEKNIDLPNLFCSNLCLSPSNDNINNLKDNGDFQKRTNSMTVVIVNIMTLSLIMLQVGVNSKKRRLIESFHQTNLTEIQVINKNIKGLNRRTIYRTFKAINESKGIHKNLDQEEIV